MEDLGSDKGNISEIYRLTKIKDLYNDRHYTFSFLACFQKLSNKLKLLRYFNKNSRKEVTYHEKTFFTNLNSIRVGAEVQVTTKAGVTHSYTVEEMRVVAPYEDWVTEKSDAEVLTLFTCAEHGTKRFVCRCVPVEDYDSERGDVDGE